MNLCVDIGNSSAKLAVFKGNGIIDFIDIRTEFLKNNRFGEKENEKFFKKYINNDIPAAVSSVVPEATDNLINHMKKYCDVDIRTVKDLDYELGIDYEGLIGEDRLMAVYAASKIFGPSTIIVDIGSALTFSVLGKDNRFKGGMISLGPFNILKALSEKTSQIPLIDLKVPGNNVGQNTEEAVNSGVFWGIIGAIEKSVRQIEENVDEKCKVILTGGFSVLFVEYIDRVVEIDPFLVLRGINYLLDKNNNIY